MKKFRVLLLGALMILVLVALAGCGQKAATTEPVTPSAATPEATAPATPAVSKISIAVINDYPPFEYKESGKLTGFDIELVEAIAKNQNLKVDWKEMKFDGIIPALQSKQIDGAISAITIRPDRAEVVDFTTPYFKSGLSLVVKQDSTIQKLEDLKDKTIVAKQGTTGLETAKKLADQYGAKVRVLQDDTTLYLDVEAGNADATINDFPGAAYKIKIDGQKTKLRILGDKLTGEDYGIAIQKGNKELLDKFNAGLKALQDSGEFKQIYEKYFGVN